MKHVALIVITILIATQLLAQGIRGKVNAGNEAFKKGDYEQALTLYKDALLDDPLNEIALFNQADALYKLKKYDQAIENYQKVTGSKDLQLSARAYYNIGNALFQQNKLQQCIQAYKKSLELNSNDFEAKYNLELARAKLKEMSKKQKQQQNGQKQNQQRQKIEPSEFAKQLKARAEELVAKQQYARAFQLMSDGLKKDKTVAAFQSFINRIKDVVDISEGV